MSYTKLVRDNIPNIIKSNGQEPITRILSNEEYKSELEKKLMEECNEVLLSKGNDRIEELADVLEVIIALSKIEGKTLADVIETGRVKRLERGSFDKKIFLEGVR